MRTFILCALSALCGTKDLALAAAPPAAANDRHARVVLLVPLESEPPENYESRLDALAERTERLFAKWMKHWGYPVERTRIFARDDNGKVEVTIVEARLVNNQGRTALPEARQVAMKGAARELGLDPGEEVVWWILYHYPGIKGFQGGAMKFGGMAINAYPPGVDPIDKDLELAAPALAAMNLKGTIHEFGHALGLPHIGPKPSLKLGNSLMGPVNRAYWGKSGSDDTRVYLSQAGAAALWKHPIFRKEATPTPPMPGDVKVGPLEIKEAPDGSKVMVRGKLTADTPAHSALLLDSERGRFGDYWERPYVGKIDKMTGDFEIVIDDPFPRGTLFLSFCFETGINTADGKTTFQRGSTIEIPYETKDKRRVFAQEGLE